MITLSNVSKTYVSKKKKLKVDALRGVSFELGNTGMVVILGKSGSGKSTLLNLIGGLDSPTTGEIVVDGVSMKDFKQADYEGYRNGYVGFIFQEYNLLDEFNVKDNIALALHLSKGDNIDERVLTALQQVELNEDYLTRQVGEMSGGEKQRIAIARTIVKESKMILADEPTGNLDAATGESIWKILKSQSQSKLVVVVSHDRESAEKYADRVIELADGSVVSDSGEQKANNEVKETFTPQKKRLPFATCFKMGVNSLLQHKVKSVCVLLLSILSLLALIIAQLCLSYSANLTIAKFIKNNNVEYIGIKEDRVPRKEDKDFLDEHSTYIKKYNGTDEAVVKRKQDIFDMGWSFVGEAIELNQDSFYISTIVLKEIEESIEKNKQYENYYYYLDDNGDTVYINEKPTSWEFLIGKRVYLGRFNSKLPSILAGIVDLSAVSEFTTEYIPRFFTMEEFSVDYREGYNPIKLTERDGYVDFGGEKQYTGSLQISGNIFLLDADVFIAEGGKLIRRSEVTIGAGEIVISYEMLNALFNVKERTSYVRQRISDYVLVEVPEQIGQTFSFVLYDEQEQVIADFGELKIVGVSFNLGKGQDVECCVSPATTWEFIPKIANEFLVKTSSVRNLRSFITNLEKEHCTLVDKAGTIRYLLDNKNHRDCSMFAYEFTPYIESFTVITNAISLILTLILFALVTNLISLSITGRKKEIGILSALGTSNKDIAKIFIIETLVISIITFVVVLVGAFICVAVFNNYYTYDYYKIEHLMSFFNVELPTVATLIAGSFGLLLLAALLPLIKIAKTKPIDAIRNL